MADWRNVETSDSRKPGELTSSLVDQSDSYSCDKHGRLAEFTVVTNMADWRNVETSDSRKPGELTSSLVDQSDSYSCDKHGRLAECRNL
ncbi:hypothetical protein RRG08_062679 [Elysia crispata]|uniref:Uncharacterized protein n=1 Tax=Elysia crispata TaxID=231223 RepID=A0AAE0XMT5_9GAST|nr:hypothetical protein RRG08_062679 [Elysia crispata]